MDEPMTIDTWISDMAVAASRLNALGALEAAAGNISVFLPRTTPGLSDFLSRRMPAATGVASSFGPSLPPGVLLITGTGRRLPDLTRDPDGVLCAVAYDTSGAATLHRAHASIRPTSEIDSHLGIHALALGGRPRLHAVVHAQPPKTTWLSHIPAYQETLRMNRQLMRWQPETLVMLADGIGVVPFITPGTPEQGDATTQAMREHRLVVWAQHGVVARSEGGPNAAVDLIDYAEAAAAYEVLDLTASRPAPGMSVAQMRLIAERFGASTTVLDQLPEEALPAMAT